METERNSPRFGLSLELYQATAPLDLSHLTLNSTLADLPTKTFEVSPDTLGQTVAHQFEQQPDLPGVIIAERHKIVGAISRRKFLERVGRPYGVEVYLKRPIQIMLQAITARHLQLPSTAPIHQAAQLALNRPSNALFEPIVVLSSNNQARLLDVYTLLLAQSQLLTLGYQIEQNRRQFAEALQRTGRVLSSSLKLHEVTTRILAELAAVVAYRRGAVLLHNGKHLEVIAKQGFPEHLPAKDLQVAIQSDQDDIFHRMSRTHNPVLIADVTAERSWQYMAGLPVDHSWMGVPLISQNQVIGLISLTRAGISAFTNEDASLVLAFASQAAVALENARLYDHILRFNDQLEQMVDQRTAELNRAYNILEKLDKTKSDFIKVSAHELRTPLTVIKGYTQVLRANPAVKSDPTTAEMLDGIVTGVDRLYQVVNSMLDLAKIDSDNLVVYPEEVILASMIHNIRAKLATDLELRQLELICVNLDDLPVIQADPELLAKVFYSLIVNAIKYTPDGGQITVSGKTDLGTEAEAYVEVIIGDTGIGIDPDQQEIIFEKFYQTGQFALHSSGFTKFKGSGPGLGLAVAKGIVEAHNGQIWVESPGYDETTCPGSRFHVRLPLQ